MGASLFEYTRVEVDGEVLAARLGLEPALDAKALQGSQVVMEARFERR